MVHVSLLEPCATSSMGGGQKPNQRARAVASPVLALSFDGLQKLRHACLGCLELCQHLGQEVAIWLGLGLRLGFRLRLVVGLGLLLLAAGYGR